MARCLRWATAPSAAARSSGAGWGIPVRGVGLRAFVHALEPSVRGGLVRGCRHRGCPSGSEPVVGGQRGAGPGSVDERARERWASAPSVRRSVGHGDGDRRTRVPACRRPLARPVRNNLNWSPSALLARCPDGPPASPAGSRGRAASLTVRRHCSSDVARAGSARRLTRDRRAERAAEPVELARLRRWLRTAKGQRTFATLAQQAASGKLPVSSYARTSHATPGTAGACSSTGSARPSPAATRTAQPSWAGRSGRRRGGTTR
jgi:hypothetical protein